MFTHNGTLVLEKSEATVLELTAQVALDRMYDDGVTVRLVRSKADPERGHDLLANGLKGAPLWAEYLRERKGEVVFALLFQDRDEWERFAEQSLSDWTAV